MHKSAHHAHRQPLRRHAVVEQLQRGADASKRILQGGRQRGAGIAEQQAARGALKERLAQLRLQRLDLMADRRLRDTQLVGGSGEIQVARRSLEDFQAVQGDGR